MEQAQDIVCHIQDSGRYKVRNRVREGQHGVHYLHSQERATSHSSLQAGGVDCILYYEPRVLYYLVFQPHGPC